MAWAKTRTVTCALLTALVALSFATAKEARADTLATPDGVGVGHIAVTTDAWISAEAERLSGRKLTVVCAGTAQAWVQRLTEVGLPAAAADEYYGLSLIQRGEMYLSPYVCEGLRLGIVASTRRSHELQVAWAVNVLIHESVHLGRFSSDERLTEACARIALPIELHRIYQVAFRSIEMRRLTSAATWFRRTQPPDYQGGTCSAPGT